MITVGFTLIGRGGWSGGETYQRNMFGVMAQELAGKVQAKLFLSPEQYQKIGTSFDRFLAQPAIVDERVNGAGGGRRAVQAAVLGRDQALADLVMPHGLDVMFESAQWFGNRFPIPVISWIPDFQHRHMGHLFSRKGWWHRDIGFRFQTSGRRVIMLSSEDARNDCDIFFPVAKQKTKVVRFAIDLNPAPVFERAKSVREAHDLPERFFYLPNQFWAHKNHAVVVKALKVLQQRDQLSEIPPIALTGRTEDPRNPNLYKSLISDVTVHGLSKHFRHLGLIPYEDVFALNAAADHLINPSKFEGWSTPVEEAKALGTPMILSDLGIHREQAPTAKFFAPDDAEALASILHSIRSRETTERDDLISIQSNQTKRRHDYARDLMTALTSALQQRTA
jgi:glycosyltransferase involved in cell wall biosynthesis